MHKGAILSEKSPTAKEQRAAYRTKWADHNGSPARAYCDMARNTVGGDMLRGFEGDGRHLVPIAGEAHWQLTYAERHNGIIAEAIELALAAVQPQSEEEYLAMVESVFEAKNRLARRLGHSAFQIAFGRDPKTSDSLLDDEVSAATKDLNRPDTPYVRAAEIRLKCRIAVFRAADNQTLREVIGTRPRPHREFAAKDVVYYYRKSRSRKLGYWRGPATVIGHEHYSSWVAHADQVLKCCAEHLRFASSDELLAPEIVDQILRQAQHQLGSGRRGAFRYTDLTSQDFPPSDQDVSPGAPFSPAEAAIRGGIAGTPSVASASITPSTASASAASSSSSSSSSTSLPNAAAGAREETFAEKRTRLEKEEAGPPAEPIALPEVLPPTLSAPAVSARGVPVPSDDDELGGDDDPPMSAAQAMGQQDVASGVGSGPDGSPDRGTKRERGGPGRPVRMRRRSNFGPILSSPRDQGTSSGSTMHARALMLKTVFEELCNEAACGRSDSIRIGEENEFHIGDDGPRRGKAPKQLVAFLDPDALVPFAEVDELNEQEINFSGIAKSKHWVFYEKDLSAKDMLKCDNAKLQELRTVAYEKKTVRILDAEESAWVRSVMPQRFMTSMFALKWKAPLDSCLAADPEAKARWAIRGCGVPDLHELVFTNAPQSPSLSFEARHWILQILASKKWRLCLGDVTGALRVLTWCARTGELSRHYLEGGIPGSGLRGDQLVEVIKPFYSLNDSPQRWWSTVREEAIRLGAECSVFDSRLYSLYEKTTNGKGAVVKKLRGVVGHHVDDFVCGGSGKVWDAFVE